MIKIGDISVDVSEEELELKNVVYLLIFPNGKKYVGITSKRFKDRLYQHCSLASNEKDRGYNSKKARAIRKYKEFKGEVLFEGNSNELGIKEIEFIKEYDTYNNGYNSTFGGEYGTLGSVRSDISKQKSKDSSTNKKYVIVRNIFTGEILDFKSVQDCADYFEVKLGIIIYNRDYNLLFLDIYEIKFLFDDWEYEDFSSEYINENLFLESCIIKGNYFYNI